MLICFSLGLWENEIYFTASAPPVGAMTGALLAGIVLQKFGRKITLMVSVAIAFFAFLVLATSDMHELASVMIIARIFQGMSVGFSMASATIYVSFMFCYDHLQNQLNAKY